MVYILWKKNLYPGVPMQYATRNKNSEEENVKDGKNKERDKHGQN